MNRSRAFLVVLLAVPALSSYAFAIPETTVTRTHLMKDIDKSTITVLAGVEIELTKDPGYMGDSFFGYCSYAPLDWVEIGIAGHTLDLTLHPSIDAKIDMVDIFTGFSRFSLLLMGGAGGLPEDLSFYHGGLALNFRLNQHVQLYLGSGSDSISEALIVQAGACISLLKSLGISTSLKLVTCRAGTDLMFSLAPLAALRL